MQQTMTVSQLNEYVASVISNDDMLSSLIVEGEISNFTAHSSGHLYFSIKDKNSSIRCIMFSGAARYLKFSPKDGSNAVVYGYLSFYKKTGQCQITVERMQLAGEGDLYLQFERLKEKLLKEGLFDESAKKPLPYMPENIGLITSATGAVIQDIKNTLGMRYPNYGMILYPALMQGEKAHTSIIEAIEYFNKNNNVDVIIIARGGGSIEDLWPFNNEKLAYAIHNSYIPVISAIGHETDYTISDFTADARAATPTAAAQMVMPLKSELKKQLEANKEALNLSLNRKIKLLGDRINGLSTRPVMKRPQEYTNVLSLNLDHLTNRHKVAALAFLNEYMNETEKLSHKLEALNPLSVLMRGYSITTDSKGAVVTSIDKVKPDELISTRVSNGSIISIVQKQQEEQEEEGGAV